MNHHLEKHYHTNHDTITNNTRSKRRATEDAIPPPNQALTLDDDPNVLVMNAQSNVTPQQR